MQRLRRVRSSAARRWIQPRDGERRGAGSRDERAGERVEKSRSSDTGWVGDPDGGDMERVVH